MSIVGLWWIKLKWSYVRGLIHDIGLFSCVDEFWQRWELSGKFVIEFNEEMVMEWINGKSF